MAPTVCISVGGRCLVLQPCGTQRALGLPGGQQAVWLNTARSTRSLQPDQTAGLCLIKAASATFPLFLCLLCQLSVFMINFFINSLLHFFMWEPSCGGKCPCKVAGVGHTLEACILFHMWGAKMDKFFDIFVFSVSLTTTYIMFDYSIFLWWNLLS